MSTNCCYVEMLYMSPQLTIGGACSSWQLVKWQAQVHRGQWEWKEDMRRQGRGLWVTQHKGVNHSSLQGRGYWLTGVWIRHSRGNGWNLSHEKTLHMCILDRSVCWWAHTLVKSKVTHAHTHKYAHQKGNFLLGDLGVLHQFSKMNMCGFWLWATLYCLFNCM